jgi:hypothetical protein
MCQPNEVGGCTDDTQCCSGICEDAFRCKPCRTPLGACASGQGCCNSTLGTNNTCVNGTCCAMFSQRCATDDDCCPGLSLSCTNGVCSL